MFRLTIQFLALLTAIGCDKPDAPAPATTATQQIAKLAQAPTAFGTLRGKVTLTGWNPPTPAATMVTCGDHQIPIADQKVILTNGGLEDVDINLKNAPPLT